MFIQLSHSSLPSKVEQLFMEDLKTVQFFCDMLQPEYSPMLAEMERQFLTEFDFTREGWALEAIGEPVNESFPNVRIPKPYREYCTKRVCVMERMEGTKLVDGINAFYKDMAAKRGMTLDQFRESMKSEHAETKQVSSLQLELARQIIRFRSTLWNVGAGFYNYTAGWLLPNVGYDSAVLPLNHVRVINELLDVHGFQIFELGIFNGDPHPGNILLAPDESLMLIDFGQVKQFSPKQRYDLARMILTLCENDSEAIVKQFQTLGFATEKNDQWVIERTARFFFEDDSDPALQTRKDGSRMNLQQVSEYLNKEDKTVDFPDWCFMAIRTAMLLRGLASHLGMGVNVAHVWRPHAEKALKELAWIEESEHHEAANRI